MNPGLGSAVIPIHPCSTSIALFETLQGKFTYVRGQTLHASLRNSGVLSRQLFVHLYNSALNGCTYDDLLSDWRAFDDAVRARWRGSALRSTPGFKTSTFQSWASTLRMTLDDLVLNTLFAFLYSKTTASYEKFVDWTVCLGLIPVVRRAPDRTFLETLDRQMENLVRVHSGQRTIKRTLYALQRRLHDVASALTMCYIPDFMEVEIEYLPDRDEFRGTYRGRPIQVEVLHRPVVTPDTITFDSPVQRLYGSVMSTFRTAEHAKLCQLLNTSPVKAITVDGRENLYRDIMTHLEQSSRKSDPKQELMRLLVKLAENKTVSGVTDVVEEFITDVSQNIVDRNKLFGTGGTQPETAAQGLKKQVSSSIFKCLTNQINEQFDTIHALQRENELTLKKVKQLESALSLARDTADMGQVPQNLLTASTLDSISGLSANDAAFMECTVSKGATVMNSFLSQYVPPVRDALKDLTTLWESELFQTYKMAPVVDNQGQRISVRYTQDTVSLLLGPFTYMIARLAPMELLPDGYVTMSLSEIASDVYNHSRTAVYISDIGLKFCPNSEQRHDEQQHADTKA